jgi:predicted CXXCH cytochrome family protein
MRRLVLFGLALLCGVPLQAQQRTRSPHGELRLECKACHRSNGWTPAKITKAFNHAKFGFRLQGAHETAACRACHASLDFKGAKSNCASCHEDKHRGELGADCAKCHTSRSFIDREVMTKAHQLTRFALQGGHLAVDCAGCHKPGAQGSMQFVGTQTLCVSCHQTNYAAAPNHVSARFPTGCEGCHNQVAWNRVEGMGGSHPTTPIALSGVHGNSQCTDCHGGLAYSAVKQTCDGCHHTDYVNTNNPKHVDAGFALTCTDCHGLVAGWTGATYAHASTPVPVSGAHATVACTDCHTTAPYSTVKQTCDGCHHPVYVGTTNPNHANAGYTTDCAACHQVVANWAGATANHPTAPLALTGVHANRQCTDCHLAGQVYAAVKQTCDGCHHTDYTGAKDPDHVAAGFALVCTDCHTLTPAWAGATWNHPTTPVVLTGGHSANLVACTQCHTSSPYSTVKRTCDGCHHPDYTLAADPPHQAAGLALTCENCHTQTVWTTSTFVHATAPISLAGAHTGVTCAACHTTTPYSTVKTTCDGCHHPDYVATTNPSHTAAGYSTDCASCHQVVTNWAGAAVNHPTAPLALTGVHANKLCTDCHLAGQAYSAVKTTCDGCHHTDFVAAKDPDHVAANFAVTCTDCHALVAGWTGASYASHSTVPINPKQGAHAAVTCAQCHTRSPYSSAPTTCDGCHHPDYVATTNPNHASANFALTCADCHQVVAGWTGATFASHPSSPLAMTGPHSMSVRQCSDCHTTSTYASVATTCDGCHHATFVGVTDPNHQAVGMSAFAAANCATCHSPTKSAWTSPTWTHMTIVRPQSIRLPHQGASCADCHQTSSDYTVKSCAKSGCHRNVNGP